jgi:hypothetical protein
MEYCLETLNDRILGIMRSDPHLDPEVEALAVALAGDSGGDGSRSADLDRTIVSRPTEDPKSLPTSDIEDPITDSDLNGYLDVMGDIVDALIYIHDSKMVHRDLKPQNGTSSRHILLISSSLFSNRQMLEGG